MKSLFTLLILLGLLNNVVGQDTYHNTLKMQLQSSYSLTGGDWVFQNTENAVLAADIIYGNVTNTVQNASGQDFSKFVQLGVTATPGPQWSTGYQLRTIAPVNAGDVLLLVVWMRSVNNPGKVSLVMDNATTYVPEFNLEYPVQTAWQQYLIPFEASANFVTGNLEIAIQLNWQTQTLQIGGLALLNYGATYDLEDMPRLIRNDQYEGWEPDAPWRAQAAARIEQIRKADMNIQVKDQLGNPVEGAAVEVKMLQHEFGFGSAVVAARLMGNTAQDLNYRNKLLNLDGAGHGFNTVVFENDTKWNAWEQNWFGTTPAQKAQATQWLRDRDITVRGHTLLWPSWGNMPADIQNNQGNPTYLLNRIRDHIEDIVTYPGIEGNFVDWDVLNEISVLNDLANALKGKPGYATGREVYVDVFNKLLEVDPDAVTYINDYTTFGNGSIRGHDGILKSYIQEIEGAGLQTDGIGFQAHIGAFPSSIPGIYSILEDFHNTFDTRAKITEFDMNPLIDDELAAAYLTDFYTICFSHESMDGILMWGFWDGGHWFNNAPLFRQDWSLKPAGQAFNDLVFNQWWTHETGTTGPDGQFNLRGFKGQYEIKVTCNGQTQTQTVALSDDLDLEVTCAAAVAAGEPDQSPGIRVFPNPARDMFQVEWREDKAGTLRIFDLMGREVLSKNMAPGNQVLPVALPAGIYQLSARSVGRTWMKRVVVAP